MDYKNAKIYVIKSKQTNNVYIGSTCQSLDKRLNDHKYNYKRWLNGKYDYTSSYEIIKYNDCYIELLEAYSCDTKQELHKREGYHIKNNVNCVNRFVAGRTIKEYREDNKEKMKEYQENNKEKIAEKMKQKITCECGSVIRIDGKYQHKKSKKHKAYIQSIQS